MCITTSVAKLSNTLIYTGTGQKKGEDVHVLAYQNTADSYGPNAMILPFPTSEAMDENNIIDTRPFRSFLEDITDASKMQMRTLGKSKGLTLGCAGLDSAKVFDVGSYTVVLAEKAIQIREALTRVPSHKRPTISTQFLIGFSKLYPDRPIAVCCWDGHLKAEPLLWWYVPNNPEVLFAPTMDAHDGNAPDVEAIVETDHIVSVGSSVEHRVGHHYQVDYSESIPVDVQDLLPRYVYGMRLDHRLKNGDMFLDANKLGYQKSGKDVPRIMRGTQFDSEAESWKMYGWS